MPDTQSPDPQHKPAENEIAEYYEGVKKTEMMGHEAGIRKARNALFATAALFLIGEVANASIRGIEMTPLFIGILVIEVGVFVGLAFWTKTRPFTAIIVGLILFVGLWVLSITVDETAIYKGILVKLIILYFLISALKPAKAWEDLKKAG